MAFDQQGRILGRQHSLAPDANSTIVALAGPHLGNYQCSAPVRYVKHGGDEEISLIAQGYEHFFPKSPPVDYEDRNKDKRRCERPMDIASTNEPHKDTAKFFPLAVKNIRNLFQGEAWRPGFPILEDMAWVPSADQAKACVSYYQPRDTSQPLFLANDAAARCNLIPTSRGFLVDRLRGTLHGLGWGDFDKFTEWQFQGRKVQLEMLKRNKVFRSSCLDPLHFVSPSGEPQKVPLVVDLSLGSPSDVDPDAPGNPGPTLYQLLDNKKQRNDNRDAIYGGRGRGGRGGRRGGAGWS